MGSQAPALFVLTSPNPKMRGLFALSVSGCSYANPNPGPGGYTGLGGLYRNLDQNKDYMDAAKGAAQMAQHLFEDESLTLGLENRQTRQTVYVPTFFTNTPQAQQAADFDLTPHARPSRQSADQAKAQTFDLPIYYNEYRPRNQQCNRE